MKVLLVDDDPFVLELLHHQLNHLSIGDVSSCEDAARALDLINGAHDDYDLLFCDLNMPGMDGVEFVRHLAERRYGGGVVLISGEDPRTLATVKQIARARKLDVLGALTKPVGQAALRRVLGKAGRHSAGEARRGERRRYSAAELREALAAHQLVNHYQPQIDLVNGAMVGVETLVRWSHPRDGLVYPDQFITTAEDHGLIDDLTQGVLEGALRQVRDWHREGLNPLISVNVSMDNLTALDFPDSVAAALARAQVPARRIILEVTESQLPRDRVTLLDIVTRLRLKRIGLSIDDFGTGHSSLAQLRDIPFDELKLDRSFVHGAARKPALRTIVESNVHMAQELGMRVVAEGVEDDDDWHCIRNAGCHVAQGWFMARAMPGPALSAWARQWEARRTALYSPAC